LSARQLVAACLEHHGVDLALALELGSARPSTARSRRWSRPPDRYFAVVQSPLWRALRGLEHDLIPADGRWDHGLGYTKSTRWSRTLDPAQHRRVDQAPLSWTSPGAT